MENRIKRIGNNVGIIYLGDWIIDYYGDEDFKREIHRKADIELKAIILGNKSILFSDNVLIISLILIAMDKYDGSFYDYIYEYYPLSFSENVSDQTIYNKIREVIRKVYKVDNFDNTRIINSILEESFVPINYVSHLYDFVYDILDYNYDFDISFSSDTYEDIYDELRKLFSHLFLDNESSDNLNLSYESKVKTYRLIKSTKNVLSNPLHSHAIIPIIINIMKILHSYYYELPITDLLLNDYYKIGFDKWIKEFSRNEKAKSINSSAISNTKPRIVSFDYRNKEVSILTRRHFINMNDLSDFEIQLINNGEIVYSSKNLVVKKVIGGVRIDPYIIKTDNFIGNLSYRIISNDIELYNSENTITKDVYVFKSDGEILKKNNNYVGNIYVISDRELKNEEFNHEKLKNGNLYLGYKNNDTQLDFGSSRHIFHEIESNVLLGNRNDKINAYFGTKKLDVYLEVTRILLNSKIDDEGKLSIVLNNSNKINIPKDKIQLASDDKREYTILELDFLDLFDGHNRIEVIFDGKETKGDFEFILDSKLFYEEKNYATDGLRLTLKSSFFSENIKSIPLDNLIKNEIKPFEINFKNGFNTYKYTVDYSFTYYSINDSIYHYSKYIWLDDIDKNIEIFSEGLISYSVECGNTIAKQINIEDGEPLVFTKGCINDFFSKGNNSQIIINLRNQNNFNQEVKILRSNVLAKDGFKIFKDDSYYYINLIFEGRNSLVLTLLSGGKELLSHELKSSNNLRLKLSMNKHYGIELSEGSNDFFSLTPHKIIYKTSFIDYAPSEIVKHRFQIVSAYENPDSRSIDISGSFIGDLEIVGSKIIGNVYSKNKNRVELNNFINPVTIDLLDPIMVLNDGEETTFSAYVVDKDDDGIIFNPRLKRIHGRDSHNLPAVDRFIIKMKRWIDINEI